MAKRAELNDAGGARGDRRPSVVSTPLAAAAIAPADAFNEAWPAALSISSGWMWESPSRLRYSDDKQQRKKKRKKKKEKRRRWVVVEIKKSRSGFFRNPPLISLSILSLSLSARRWKRWTLKGIDGAKIQSRRERKGSAPFGIGPDDSTPSTVLSTWKSMLKRSFLQHCQRAENDKNTRELGQS